MPSTIGSAVRFVAVAVVTYLVGMYAWSYISGFIGGKRKAA